jgi:hypothetical protein
MRSAVYSVDQSIPKSVINSALAASTTFDTDSETEEKEKSHFVSILETEFKSQLQTPQYENSRR